MRLTRSHLAATLAAATVTVLTAALMIGHAGTGQLRPDLGAGRHRHDPPRHDDVHGGCPVHRQLRVHRRRRQRVRRLRRALRRHRRGDRHRRLPVQLAPARHPGQLHRGRLAGQRGHQGGLAARSVYSSWDTMDKSAPTNANTCAYNDFALVKVDAADVGKVNPSIPFWGGPTGIDTNGTAAGDRVYTYGNSSLRAGIELLSPHTGISLGDDAADGGWSHPLYTVTPGVPGDSGSAFLSGDGKAIGALSTLGLAPLPLSNNIGDLAKELAFAQQHSGISGLQLVNGTEPFSPIL